MRCSKPPTKAATSRTRPRRPAGRAGAALGAGLMMIMLAAAGCGDDDAGSAGTDGTAEDPPAADAGPDTDADQQQFPDVLDVEVERSGDTFDFAVTISSPYDTPERYADGWRVMDPDGTVYGEHELAHDHANEQPFTRTQTGVAIPDDVDQVVVEGRDLANGYGGETVTVGLPTG